MKPSWRHNLPFEVVEGDIGAHALAHGPWLAVVSSDDSYLSHGGGSSRSIWKAAGLDEFDPREFNLPLPLGSIVSTEPGKLSAHAVLHAVTLEFDRRTRIDLPQCERLFQNLAAELDTLASRSSHRRVLLPLIGTGAARLAEGIVAERTADLIARLASRQLEVTLATKEHTARIRRRLTLSYGCIDLPSSLADSVVLSDHPRERLLQAFALIEAVLTEGVAPAIGEPMGLHRPGLAMLWERFQQSRQRSELPSAVRDALDFMPEVIRARNQTVHDAPSERHPVISANMAASALRALLHCAERGWVPGFGEEQGRALLARRATGGPAPKPKAPSSQSAKSIDSRAEDIRRGRAAECPVRHSVRGFGVSPRVGCRAEPVVGSLAAPVSAISVSTSPPPNQASSIHVRNLATLLLNLPKPQLEHLLEKLDETGYRGDDDKRLVEYCTRVEPATILDDLGARELRTLLKSRFSIESRATASTADLRDQLLLQLGFRIPPQLSGLQSALDELEQHRKAVPMADSDSLYGRVVKGSGRFERTIRDLLRFMCLYLFGTGPEKHFKDKLKSSAASSDFGKASLGTLLHCLELLAKEIEQLSASGADAQHGGLKQLQVQLTATRLVPEGVNGISRLRNLFAHISKEQTVQQDRETAREFFDRAIAVLKHWMSADPPVYPTIVVVEEIRLDRWNRRTIVAQTDGGGRESIICDNDLKPGDVYFMYPLSNPMRVDPILIRFEPDAVVP